ncbi:MAG: hypothetical protein IJ649_04880 [Oscillospiraceae bacterium]|nr:hypothetical protein [Oscillospiraceae bacterium]
MPELFFAALLEKLRITGKQTVSTGLSPAGDTRIRGDPLLYEMPLDFPRETWYKKSKVKKLLIKTIFP